MTRTSKLFKTLVILLVFPPLHEGVRWNEVPCGLPSQKEESVYELEEHDSGMIRAVYNCKPDYEMVRGDYVSYCLPNNTWSGDPLICQDRHNCVDHNLPCRNNGTCVELTPSFRCVCKTSYRGSLCDHETRSKNRGPTCHEDRTCERGRCVQKPASLPWKLSSDGNWGPWSTWSNCSSTCDRGVTIKRRLCDNPPPTGLGKMCRGNSMEVKYCDPGNCPIGMYEWCNNATDRCEQVSGRAWCSVYDKAYTCTCNTGLKEETDEQGNFIKCADVDECELGIHTCDKVNGQCTNTYGSYQCSCIQGFHGNGSDCANIDECKMKLHRCDEMAKCYDTEGSYLCRCVKGYRSISVNHTGFHGQCKEERMVSFGATAGDKRATNISMATNEIATELQRIPTGIPVEDGSGNAIHCKSFYASENGILIITNLTVDNKLKPTFRNSKLLSYSSGGDFSSLHQDSICAIIAPMWTDAELDEESHIWYQVYNIHDLEKVDRKRRDKLSVRLKSMLPENFQPIFVGVITWEKLIPPWPSRNERMTFQSILFTDGIATYIANIYDDADMTWRPVYDVPRDITFYPAMSGYIIQGKVPYVMLHDASGKWEEDSDNTSSANIYRMNKERSNSKNLMGTLIYNLTPSFTSGSSPERICYNWYRIQNEATDYVRNITAACPSTLDLLHMEKMNWDVTDFTEDENICYAWSFVLEDGGKFDCCYSKNTASSPLITGRNAVVRGAGTYYVNKTVDNVMKKKCCTETNSNYFCWLYTKIHPVTSSLTYVQPMSARARWGAEFSNFQGIFLRVKGHGELILLNRTSDKNLIVAAQISNESISALGLQIHDIKMELYASYSRFIDSQVTCVVNNQSCEGFRKNGFVLHKTENELAVAEENGFSANISLNINGSLDVDILLKPSDMMENISGLLVDEKLCRDNEQTTTSCDLFAGNQRKINEKSFFSRVQNYVTQSTLDFMIRVDQRSETKTGNELSNPLNHVQTPPSREDLTVVATKLNSEEYFLQINVSEFMDATISVIGKESFLKDNGTLSFNSTNLDNITLQISQQNETRLIYPNIVICSCDTKHSKCNPFSTAPYLGPSAVLGGCECDLGYVGERCENQHHPCRSHPCFFDVECLEISKDRKSLFWKYQCGECPHAFERGNGEKCYHANPCLESEDEVCANAQCVNTPHSYTCECFNGYMKDTKTSLECIDINECQDPLACDFEHSVCDNIPGSYKCNCKAGFKLKEKTHHCVDIDECLINNGGCSRRCRNTAGSYECECEIGYKLNEDLASCREINECDEYASPHCQQLCSDIDRGKPFHCKCRPRYELADNYADCLPLFTFDETVEQTTTSSATLQSTATPTTTQPEATTAFITTTASSSTKMITTSLNFPSTTSTKQVITTVGMVVESTVMLSQLNNEDRGIVSAFLDEGSFMLLSDDERHSVIEILKRLHKLLLDKAFLSLLRTLARKLIDFPAVCFEQDLPQITNMGKVFELLRNQKSSQVLKMKIDLQNFEPKSLFPNELTFRRVLDIFTKLQRCQSLRSSVEKRQAQETGTVIAEIAISSVSLADGSMKSHAFYLWIGVISCLVAVFIFIFITAVTRFCFPSKHPIKLDIEKLKSAKCQEKIDDWPRVVMMHET